MDIRAVVNTGIDPDVVIDFLVPWEAGDFTIAEVIRSELYSLLGEAEGQEAFDALRAVENLSLTDHPEGIDVTWEPVEAHLDEGAVLAVDATLHAEPSAVPVVFPCCFLLREQGGEILGCSDVLLVSSTGEGTIRVDFLDDDNLNPEGEALAASSAGEMDVVT